MGAVELRNVSRVYRVTTGIVRRRTKEVTAVDDLSFEVAEGELLGMLGPNGAGKTTVIRMLTTLLLPTSGTVRVAGLDVASHASTIRPLIGFVFGGERGLYYRLSGRDNLRYFAELYKLPGPRIDARVDELLELVGLRGRADELVEGYSRGMKQRLHLARMLLHDPNILFLDEPTIGLDPVGARELRETVRQLSQLFTHFPLQQFPQLAPQVAVPPDGREFETKTWTWYVDHDGKRHTGYDLRSWDSPDVKTVLRAAARRYGLVLKEPRRITASANRRSRLANGRPSPGTTNLRLRRR